MIKIFFSLLLEANVSKLRRVIESVIAKHYISLDDLNWNSLCHLKVTNEIKLHLYACSNQ